MIDATFAQLPPGVITPPTTATFEPVGQFAITGLDPENPGQSVNGDPSGTMQTGFSAGAPGTVVGVVDSLHLTIENLPNGTNSATLFSPVDQFIIVDDTTIVPGASYMLIDEVSGETIGAISTLISTLQGNFSFAGLISGTTDLGTGDTTWNVQGVQCVFEDESIPVLAAWGWVLLAVFLAVLAIGSLILRRAIRNPQPGT